MSRRQHEPGTLRRPAQLQQGIDAPGRYGGGGRTPVIGRAVPGDQRHDFKLRREEGQGAPDADEPPMVADDVQKAGRSRLLGKAGKQHRIIAFRRACDDPAPWLHPVKIPIHG